ncbi:unnamed protein product [Lampetra planeri]
MEPSCKTASQDKAVRRSAILRVAQQLLWQPRIQLEIKRCTLGARKPLSSEEAAASYLPIRMIPRARPPVHPPFALQPSAVPWAVMACSLAHFPPKLDTLCLA